MTNFWIEQFFQSRRLHQLRLHQKYGQWEVDIRLHFHLWRRCHIMEVEALGVHGPVYHRGQVHSNIEHNKGSHLAASTVNRLLGKKKTRPSNTDHLLGSQSNNTPHSKSSLSREEETYWGTVSSHLGARNKEETRSPEDWHRGEHHRLPDEATPRTTLRDNDGIEQNRAQWGVKGKSKIELDSQPKSKHWDPANHPKSR